MMYRRISSTVQTVEFVELEADRITSTAINVDAATQHLCRCQLLPTKMHTCDELVSYEHKLQTQAKMTSADTLPVCSIYIHEQACMLGIPQACLMHACCRTCSCACICTELVLRCFL